MFQAYADCTKINIQTDSKIMINHINICFFCIFLLNILIYNPIIINTSQYVCIEVKRSKNEYSSSTNLSIYGIHAYALFEKIIIQDIIVIINTVIFLL